MKLEITYTTKNTDKLAKNRLERMDEREWENGHK